MQVVIAWDSISPFLFTNTQHTHTVSPNHHHTFLKASVRICVDMGDHFQRGLLLLPSTFGLSKTEFKLVSAVSNSVKPPFYSQPRERERERENRRGKLIYTRCIAHTQVVGTIWKNCNQVQNERCAHVRAQTHTWPHHLLPTQHMHTCIQKHTLTSSPLFLVILKPVVQFDPLWSFHCHSMRKMLREVTLIEVGLLHNFTLWYGVLVHVLSDCLGNQYLVTSVQLWNKTWVIFFSPTKYYSRTLLRPY